ncbi:hypothetical protein NM688_g1263 [Phlebia brevispora]|uniref:Uncharacterized protein n=1 Tax=Phlebia brevispora TaxID=194682 RepID=A0ACC1TC08_9APHY|nr:hypothetical protein NM688_g1263 [Phlebia brevispora]
MKRALTLVSRHWNFSAIKFLYHDVVIRHVGQLVLLNGILEARPQYGGTIQRLRLQCYVPKSMKKATGRCLSAILECCPNLRSLRFGDFFITTYLQDVTWGSSGGDEVSSPLSSIMQKGPMLENVSYVVDEDNQQSYTLPIPLLETALHIVSLGLSVPEVRDGLNIMSLPVLRELPVSVTRSFSGNKAFGLRKLARWSLPSLTHLWFVAWLDPYSSGPPGGVFFTYPSYSRAFCPVLDAHGSKLQFLDISLCAVPENGRSDIMEICPRLRHLVLSSRNARWPSFRSSTLHLDVWIQYSGTSSPFEVRLGTRDQAQVCNVKKAMRGCKESEIQLAQNAGCGTIRFLSRGLITFPYLPTAFPPRHGNGRSRGDNQHSMPPPRLHDIFGMRVLEWDAGIILEDEHANTEWDDLIEPSHLQSDAGEENSEGASDEM